MSNTIIDWQEGICDDLAYSKFMCVYYCPKRELVSGSIKKLCMDCDFMLDFIERNIGKIADSEN